MAAYFGLLTLLGFPTFVSLFAYSQVSLGIASSRRILELLNRETELDQNAEGHAGVMQGSLEFRDVSFTYEAAADPTLDGISLKIQPGQTLAIVGQTGTGRPVRRRSHGREWRPPWLQARPARALL